MEVRGTSPLHARVRAPIQLNSYIQCTDHAGRIRKLAEKLGETLEFRLAFDGEMPGSDGGVVVLEKMLALQLYLVSGLRG